MKLSLERLLLETRATGFRPEGLEKVIRLIGILNEIFRDPFLRDRLVLKGGTALNLFIFEVPRLSVDIDLNYIGAATRAGMELERPKVEALLQAILEKEEFTVRRAPTEHAGGKWLLRYPSAHGSSGNLEVDLNFLHRVPLHPIKFMSSHPLGSFQALNIPVLGFPDLVAGKLVALLDRSAARDVVDAAAILEHPAFDMDQVRLPFVVMGSTARTMDLRAIQPDAITIETGDFERRVRPLLRTQAGPLNLAGMEARVRSGMARLLPLRREESMFMEALWDRGEIAPQRLTEDPVLLRRILSMPLLQWKAQNVKQHRGLKD